MIVFGLSFPCYWYAPCIIHVTVTMDDGDEQRCTMDINNQQTHFLDIPASYILERLLSSCSSGVEIQGTNNLYQH